MRKIKLLEEIVELRKEVNSLISDKIKLTEESIEKSEEIILLTEENGRLFDELFDAEKKYGEALEKNIYLTKELLKNDELMKNFKNGSNTIIQKGNSTTIGEVIKNYREQNKISQRQFAKKCKVSNGYIAMLERGGTNPNTKKPLDLTISVLRKLADGTEMSLVELVGLIE